MNSPSQQELLSISIAKITKKTYVDMTHFNKTLENRFLPIISDYYSQNPKLSGVLSSVFEDAIANGQTENYFQEDQTDYVGLAMWIGAWVLLQTAGNFLACLFGRAVK